MSEIRMLLDEIRDLKRRLQALETRQEHPGFAASDVARLSVDNTFAGVQTVPNTGLHLLDTNGSHDLIIAPGSNLTADRTLTLTTGNANRTLTMTGNATVNQDVSTAGSPSFVTGYFTKTSDTENYVNAALAGAEANWWIRTSTAFAFNLGVYNGGAQLTAISVPQNGNVLIGTTTDSGGKLQVDQSSTTAAIPTLWLNQADISEGFVDFIGTSAASAAGPISSWTVATIAGYVRCEINGAARWMAFYNDPTS